MPGLEIQVAPTWAVSDGHGHPGQPFPPSEGLSCQEHCILVLSRQQLPSPASIFLVSLFMAAARRTE